MSINMNAQSCYGIAGPSTSGENSQVEEETDEEIDVLNCTDDQISLPPSQPKISHYLRTLVPNFDTRYNQLWTLKYPHCIKASLTLIADINHLNYRNGLHDFELQVYLIEEFIFGKIDELCKKNQARSCLEFQMIDTLFNFLLALSKTPDIRNNIVLTIFPCDVPRCVFFGNFICYCIDRAQSQILDAAGLWLQQAGMKSPHSKELVMHIINYFLHESADTKPNFIATSTTAPHFISNMLTVVTYIFTSSNPPNEILRLVDTWIHTNPNVLTVPLSYIPPLPPGAITMPPVLPIAGLLFWCCLHPAKEEAYHYDRRNAIECERNALFTSIHHRVLFAVSSLKTNNTIQHLIAAQDLEVIIEKLVEHLRTPLATVSKASYIYAAGRLFEAIQTTTAVKCIYGNKQKLQYLLGILGRVHYFYTNS
ncbi:hypothetical protein PV327_007213 [Microctonus hyperodae]|uniref:Uncharacterized protein n=1 Tax=Microctonus hyperodae TaxID=165561 RepID=A0AA39KJE5_MICHY|nr:hypothetical protein PV327_007213 [Microctonus hyperodae]